MKINSFREPVFFNNTSLRGLRGGVGRPVSCFYFFGILSASKLRLEGLAENTRYSWQVRAVGSGGQSAYSDRHLFTSKLQIFLSRFAFWCFFFF